MGGRLSLASEDEEVQGSDKLLMRAKGLQTGDPQCSNLGATGKLALCCRREETKNNFRSCITQRRKTPTLIFLSLPFEKMQGKLPKKNKDLLFLPNPQNPWKRRGKTPEKKTRNSLKRQNARKSKKARKRRSGYFHKLRAIRANRLKVAIRNS